LNVLVVDDSRATRAYVRGALKAFFHCDVTEAGSGFEALRALPRAPFELVVTDVNMPDINGIELVRFIRQSEKHADVPILIISTQSSERDQSRVMAMGANAFLSKPFEPEAFVEVVRQLVPSAQRTKS
jgi:two-component system chemotaxis response regulator CheY